MRISPLIIVSSGAVLIVILAALLKYRPRKINQKKTKSRWQEIQLLCREKVTWSKALSDADELLKKSLKRRKFRGKAMGEKMVSAQRLFSDNDSIWRAHNLTKKVVTGSRKSLREGEVRSALIAYRQALRDIGALQNEPKD